MNKENQNDLASICCIDVRRERTGSCAGLSPAPHQHSDIFRYQLELYPPGRQSRKFAESCPTGAILAGDGLRLDMGRCLFCPECVQACPDGAITFSADYQLAARKREDLVVPCAVAEDVLKHAPDPEPPYFRVPKVIER